jgi:hypothetical protein
MAQHSQERARSCNSVYVTRPIAFATVLTHLTYLTHPTNAPCSTDLTHSTHQTDRSA